MFRLTSLATALLSLFMLSAPASAYEAITGPLGLLAYDKAKAYDGYTLFTPHTKVSSWLVDKIQDPGSRKTYLIDMEGNIVHTWKHDHPAFYAELLPNGNLLRAEKIAGSPVNFGGWYGLLREYAWDGKVVWEYKVSNPRQIAHHGFDRLPNGNTAILIWENKTYDEALAKGRDPKDKALSRNGMPAPGQGPDGQPLQGIWPDAILEVTPKGEIAWEWHVWDNIGTGPDQIDINWHLPLSMGYFARADWTHWNSVRYNAKTDQYAVNSRDFGEIYIIDRKTKKIVWRYDPILFTAKYGVAEHIRCFQSLAERLAPYTERCVISFLDFYRKTERNMAECPVIRPGESMIAETAGAFKNIAEKYALELCSCCEGLELYGIRSGACIDPELVEKLTLKPLPIKKDKSQRPLCNCAPSVDIGSYNTCGNGCIYCYANTKPVQKKGT